MGQQKLLLVDDEVRILRTLSYTFSDLYEVRQTTDPTEALEMAKAEYFDVILSDQRMPEMLGAELLAQVKEESPSSMRMLLTGYSDLKDVVASINDGEIYRYITKPWSTEDLKSAVADAMRAARTLRESEGEELEPLEDEGQPISILILGDHPKLQEALQDMYADQYTVYMTANAEEALDLMIEHRVAVLISNVTSQSTRTIALLKLIKRDHPLVQTIAVAPSADVAVAIDLINQGQVYRYLPSKPLKLGRLRISTNSAIEYFRKLERSPAQLARHTVGELSDVQETVAPSLGTGFFSKLRALGQRAVGGIAGR